MPGFDRATRIPHDLAHFTAERELGLDRGIWGSIAGGGVFENMRVVAGKPRHDAARRSHNKREIGVAEAMAAAVHHAGLARGDALPEAHEFRGVFGTGRFPWPGDRLRAAADDYAEAGRVELVWPGRLTSPVPPQATGHARGRLGRF